MPVSTSLRPLLTAASVLAAGEVLADDRTSERVRRGESVLTELNNGARQPVFDAMRRDFPFLAEGVAGYALGDVWGRPNLDVRTRQLAAVAAFGSMGIRQLFKIHAGYALNAGVPADELKEIVYMITVTAGFPRAIEASQVLQELLEERGAAPAGK